MPTNRADGRRVTSVKRTAPDPEWVQMYRQGTPTSTIAAAARVAETTVRYHLAVAAKQDPRLRAAHRAAARPATRVTAAGRRNLDDVLALYRAEGRLPTKRTPRERALAIWLARRREDAAAGIPSPDYAAALDEIPNWRNPPTKQADDAARWDRRLNEVAAWLAAGNDLPRHQKTDDQEERTLGVWLHTQRIDDRAGRLTAAREALLNDRVPGWRQGRPRGGSKSQPSSSAALLRQG
ncbi:hypothetical protein QE394_001014 [Arthrobacter sp. SORGH_AS 212]|uniref:helicase associated domain-containing protein n=1 Tax=Pseudarthrobacter sp. SORGH_AS 212 TaxID=3041777 RepID=UPI00278246FD|nr:hypothetical protein [Arthrobacter sp. SORGH_AS_0212]